MRKLKSFVAALLFAALACVSCFAAGSTKIVSNDGKTKIDIVGTWIQEDNTSTCTLVFNKNGTFTYLNDFRYRGPEQLSVGPNGELTTSKYNKGSGTYKIIDGNILQRTYTSWWSNVGHKNSGTSNSELRVLGPDQFLMGDLTFTRKK